MEVWCRYLREGRCKGADLEKKAGRQEGASASVLGSAPICFKPSQVKVVCECVACLFCRRQSSDLSRHMSGTGGASQRRIWDLDGRYVCGPGGIAYVAKISGKTGRHSWELKSACATSMTSSLRELSSDELDEAANTRATTPPTQDTMCYASTAQSTGSEVIGPVCTYFEFAALDDSLIRGLGRRRELRLAVLFQRPGQKAPVMSCRGKAATIAPQPASLATPQRVASAGTIAVHRQCTRHVQATAPERAAMQPTAVTRPAYQLSRDCVLAPAACVVCTCLPGESNVHQQ